MCLCVCVRERVVTVCVCVCVREGSLDFRLGLGRCSVLLFGLGVVRFLCSVHCSVVVL